MKEVLQQAVEALKLAQARGALSWDEHAQINATRAALESALQQQPEPVAVVGGDWTLLWVGSEPLANIVQRHPGLKVGSLLYTAPPALNGYVQAFYEMARMLGIEGAQAKSPQQVYAEQIKPALERALQQQEEPREAVAAQPEMREAMMALAKLAEDSAAEFAAEIEAEAARHLDCALSGINYFLLVKEDRKFIEGARDELMKLRGAIPSAQQQPSAPTDEQIRAALPGFGFLTTHAICQQWPQVFDLVRHFASPSPKEKRTEGGQEADRG